MACCTGMTQAMPPPRSPCKDRGLREGPLTQALKVYTQRNPDDGFATTRQETPLLDAAHCDSQPEEACSPVNNSNNVPPLDHFRMLTGRRPGRSDPW